MHCGYVVAVTQLRKHSNADRLQVATFFGNDTIVDLSVEIGDIGVYFPVDLQLSEEFCNKNNLLRKKDENGNLMGIWGAMSDCSRSFLPWEENFSKGLYLAGVECVDDAQAPAGWSKWTIPGFTYLCAEVESESTFSDVLAYMRANNMALVGAVQDFTCPVSGKNYMFFPISTL